jgi:hypothetical protein
LSERFSSTMFFAGDGSGTAREGACAPRMKP